MNTRLDFASPRGQFNRFSRAAFSPIRSTRSSSSNGGDAHHGTSSLRAPVLQTVEFPRSEPHWPSWHRGPLDRLQPILTRYRD